MSLPVFGLDPSLDPGLSPADTQPSSQTNGISIDNAKVNADKTPEGQVCQLCNVYTGPRHKATIATKTTVQSNTDSSSSSAPGADSGSPKGN